MGIVCLLGKLSETIVDVIAKLDNSVVARDRIDCPVAILASRIAVWGAIIVLAQHRD